MNNDLPIIVTGTSGYIGNALVNQLVRSHPNGAIICLDTQPLPDSLLALRERILFLQVDLCKSKQIQIALNSIQAQISKPAIVFHLAALFVKDFRLRKQFTEDDYYHHNVAATQYFLNLLEKNHVAHKFLFISTALLYKKAKSEHINPDSLDIYGQTKLECEKIVQKSKIPWIIFRPVRVVGLKKETIHSNFPKNPEVNAQIFLKHLNHLCNLKIIPVDIITTFLQNAFTPTGDPSTLSIKPGNLERAYIHINDVVKAMEYAAYKDITNKIVTLTTSLPTTLRDIGKTVVDFLKKLSINVNLHVEDSNEATSIFPELDSDFDWKPRIDPSSEVINTSIHQYLKSIVENMGLEKNEKTNARTAC